MKDPNTQKIFWLNSVSVGVKQKNCQELKDSWVDKFN